MVKNNLDKIFDKYCKVLLLGTFPSEESRKEAEKGCKYCYYMNKTNQFWEIIYKTFDEKNVSNDVEDRKNFLLNNHIALWDIIEECDIDKSKDSSIKKPKFNKINDLLKDSNIKAVYVLGRKAEKLYKSKKHTKTATYLPSTSKANTIPLYKKIEKFKEELKKVKGIKIP